jgi:hypothetical protein
MQLNVEIGKLLQNINVDILGLSCNFWKMEFQLHMLNLMVVIIVYMDWFEH